LPATVAGKGWKTASTRIAHMIPVIALVIIIVGSIVSMRRTSDLAMVFVMEKLWHGLLF
jgi:hypothetical protein